MGGRWGFDTTEVRFKRAARVSGAFNPQQDPPLHPTPWVRPEAASTRPPGLRAAMAGSSHVVMAAGPDHAGDRLHIRLPEGDLVSGGRRRTWLPVGGLPRATQ